MIRATTPTITFRFPADSNPAEDYDVILITFAQGDTIILEKDKDDLTIAQNIGTVVLTQEETNLFDIELPLRVQVRALTDAGKALASRIITRPVLEVLNDEVLTTD